MSKSKPKKMGTLNKPIAVKGSTPRSKAAATSKRYTTTDAGGTGGTSGTGTPDGKGDSILDFFIQNWWIFAAAIIVLFFILRKKK